MHSTHCYVIVNKSFQVTEVGKRGWNNLAGSNYTSPQNEHASGGYGDFNNENSYQRSHSVGGNLSSGMGHQSNTNDNEWGWQDGSQKQMSSSKSYHNQFNNNTGNGAGAKNVVSSTNDDDWSGFDSYQDSSRSYQNLTTTTTATANSNSKLSTAATTQKLSEGFDSLDVKSAKAKTTSNKKSAEDDAWNLLMN